MYDRDLPYVSDWIHLGHIITNDECMSHDLLTRRREFIGKLHSLQQELGNQSPHVYIKLIDIYLIHMYGSNLWDLSSVYADSMWKTWNATVRGLYNLPYATHRFILEAIAETEHLKLKLYRRFNRFKDKIRSSANPLVTNLYDIQHQDLRSVFGRNCHIVTQMPIDTVYSVPADEGWRVTSASDLLEARDNPQTLPGFTEAEISTLLIDICSN